MAKITAMSRCAGLNHLHFTIQRTDGRIRDITFENDEINNVLPSDDLTYIKDRIALLVREAKANGATTYAQVRTYLLNRDWVE